MHPIERLRHVARARGAGPSLLGREAAGALAMFGDDPAGLVTACRRLVERHPTDGPVWWLAARVLAAADPRAEAWASARLLDDDPTVGELAAALPGDATVVVVGWPEMVAEAVRRRADVVALVVDGPGGDGSVMVRWLERDDLDAALIDNAAIATAVVNADLVLVEATAMGPDGFVAAMGSAAAAAAAYVNELPVWLVAPRGRALPPRLWRALLERVEVDPDDPWDRPYEVVPLPLVTTMFGCADPDCPVAPELLRPIS